MEHISTTSYILIHLNLFPLSSEHFRTALHILRKAVFISCSSRVRLTGGTHQQNLYILIHLTQGCEPLPPFKWNTSAQLIHLTQSLSPTQGWDLRVQHFNRALYYASCFNSYEISLLQVVFCMNIKHNHSAKSQNQKDPWKSQTPHKPLLLCSRA